MSMCLDSAVSCLGVYLGKLDESRGLSDRWRYKNVSFTSDEKKNFFFFLRMFLGVCPPGHSLPGEKLHLSKIVASGYMVLGQRRKAAGSKLAFHC